MASSQSFSMIQRRISDSPDPAAPVNSGEPLNTIASREPPCSGRLILAIMCWRNRKLPSLMRGSPAPNGPRSRACSFALTCVLDLLPFHPERRIGQHVVEVLALERIFGEGVAERDVVRVLALDHHVGAADRVGLGVQFLAVHDRGWPAG